METTTTMMKSPLGSVFRCVVDGVMVFLMGGLVTLHMARLVTFSVGGLGICPRVSALSR